MTRMQGQYVTLFVKLADVSEIPLRGERLLETPDSIQLKIAEDWVVDIRKNMIVRIEES